MLPPITPPSAAAVSRWKSRRFICEPPIVNLLQVKNETNRNLHTRETIRMTSSRCLIQPSPRQMPADSAILDAAHPDRLQRRAKRSSDGAPGSIALRRMRHRIGAGQELNCSHRIRNHSQGACIQALGRGFWLPGRAVQPPAIETRLCPRQGDVRRLRYPNTIGSNTPSTSANTNNAGAAVPTGRRNRASRAASRGSSVSHSTWRRSNRKNTSADEWPL